MPKPTRERSINGIAAIVAYMEELEDKLTAAEQTLAVLRKPSDTVVQAVAHAMLTGELIPGILRAAVAAAEKEVS